MENLEEIMPSIRNCFDYKETSSKQWLPNMGAYFFLSKKYKVKNI